MKVSIKVASVLSHYSKGLSRTLSEGECEIQDGSNVTELLEDMGYPAKVRLLVFVNGRLVEGDHRLEEGDTIYLGQTLAGG